MNQEKPTVKEYTNGQITVVWQADKCIHSENCFNGLPEVFNPKARPWINAQGASSEEIMEQIKQCPSGALSFFINENSKISPDETAQTQKAEVIPNGPLMVYGDLEVKLSDGTLSQKSRKTAFCRCGGSGNKPYCDGTHRKNGFEG
jgi:uncharacterized Fe-S cluster protein YjdI